MKIAITSQGQETSSMLDPRFGRAKWFMIFDDQSNQWNAQDNTLNLNAAQGAGIQAAQNIAQTGAEVLITGNVGPNAYKTLSAAGIKIFLVSNCSVQQALDQFNAGNLKEIDSANVQGHWV